MTIAEKIEYATNKKIVTFFKEGLFYKCYNEDAMVFSQKVRAYKVNSKFVKSVGTEVLSLGFPVSEIEKANLKLQSISEVIQASSYTDSSYKLHNRQGVIFYRLIVQWRPKVHIKKLVTYEKNSC